MTRLPDHQDPQSSSEMMKQQQQQHQLQIIQQEPQRDASRLAKVKRALLGCSNNNNNNNNSNNNNNNTTTTSSFGLEIELTEKHQDVYVPYVVYRLCTFIENRGFNEADLFRLPNNKANPKIVERMRSSFDERGDADLESASCPAAAVVLLRQFLKELPKPIVEPRCVDKLLNIHRLLNGSNNRGAWIEKTRELLSSELPVSHYCLLAYLVLFLRRYESHHGRTANVCGLFASIILPHIPPVTLLFRDILLDANCIFKDYQHQRKRGHQQAANSIFPTTTDYKVFKDPNKINFIRSIDKSLFLITTIKTPKRKDRQDLPSGKDKKLIRSNSEEKIWEKNKKLADENSVTNNKDAIRRVSSHEDFNSTKHLHILAKLHKEMGHGVRGSQSPLHERTNISPVTSKTSIIQSGDVVLSSAKYDCDAERIRYSERFSRSVTPRERRPARRRKIYKELTLGQDSSKENEREDAENRRTLNIDSMKSSSKDQSFMEMFKNPHSRSPSPARPPIIEQDDSSSQTLTDWGYQVRANKDEEMSSDLEAMLSPRTSLVIPRRFYTEDDDIMEEQAANIKQVGIKNLCKQISSLKKRIRKYEGDFEDNYGYPPSHCDKMSNRDIKRLCSELHKVRKEHKILKEGFLRNGILNKNNYCKDGDINNQVSSTMSETLKELERKLEEKRMKHNRSEILEDLCYEELLDEKTAIQKALLQIENTFGRPVAKEDRMIVKPLYDKYRALKRLLIRASSLKNKDSLTELETILEHEAMDFTSTSGNPVDCDRRASEPDMSNRGILDCIESMDQVPTDSDSQHSSSEGSRGIIESLHSLPRDELLRQQRLSKEEKKRLRRSLKEFEMQFEARIGRKMQREDRGPQINMIYDSYKEVKARVRLISALLSKEPLK